jgi:hypothetical protein
LKQSDPNNQSKLAKNNHTPQTGKQEARQKQKQQTKTTKHTIEFSNNTPVPPAQPTRGKSRVLVVRTFGNPPK